MFFPNPVLLFLKYKGYFVLHPLPSLYYFYHDWRFDGTNEIYHLKSIVCTSFLPLLFR